MPEPKKPINRNKKGEETDEVITNPLLQKPDLHVGRNITEKNITIPNIDTQVDNIKKTGSDPDNLGG